MDTKTLSYLAGLTDADGSIYITLVKKTRNYRPILSISNCNYELIYSLKEVYGGSIYIKNQSEYNWKLNYNWKVSVDKAIGVIKLILPFLKIKKLQAKLAIKAFNLRKKDQLSKLEILRKKCCKLNKRGVDVIQKIIKRKLIFPKNEEFYSYLAGLIDADGSLSIVSNGESRPTISTVFLYNCNFLPIKVLKDNFGGKFRLRKNKEESNWRACYEWSLTKKAAEKLVEKILPYLRIKKYQGLLIMRLHKLKSKYSAAFRRWHRDVAEKFLKISMKIKSKCIELNRRGNYA